METCDRRGLEDLAVRLRAAEGVIADQAKALTALREVMRERDDMNRIFEQLLQHVPVIGRANRSVIDIGRQLLADLARKDEAIAALNASREEIAKARDEAAAERDDIKRQFDEAMATVDRASATMDRARAAMDRLCSRVEIGRQMATVIYNVAQTGEWERARQPLIELRKAWDRADDNDKGDDHA